MEIIHNWTYVFSPQHMVNLPHALQLLELTFQIDKQLNYKNHI